MELYNNHLVDLLRPIDWQGGGLGESFEGCCKWIVTSMDLLEV